MRLQFLMAGAAAGHDSVKSLERLADEVRKVDPGREIEILTERRPLDIVHQIRQARVVIGTSLHVRIIAAAYGLPRVTLRRAKPAKYATHWDDKMPFNVRVNELDDAVGAALAAGRAAGGPGGVGRAQPPGRRATCGRSPSGWRSWSRVAGTPEREQLAERRQQRYLDISARRAACDVVTDQLRSELARGTARARAVARRDGGCADLAIEAPSPVVTRCRMRADLG